MKPHDWAFLKTGIQDWDEEITHNIKKHIYISHSISVIHLRRILWHSVDDKHEHDNDNNHKQDDDDNWHICQQCAKGIE